jgi:Leucine-rich repeat (LRR) protein
LAYTLKKQGKMPSPCTNAAVITALLSLQTLDISGQNLIDLSPLSMLTNLTVLNIENNQIADLSYLSDMTKLSILYASSNKLTSLSGLGGDLALTEIYVANNQITSIDALTSLKKLKSLDITNNKVGSILPLTTSDHPMGIKIGGNPGILMEAAKAPQPVNYPDNGCAILLNPDHGYSTQCIGERSTASCVWGLVNISLNTLVNNQPISTQPSNNSACSTDSSTSP